jgi:hypothetical protein
MKLSSPLSFCHHCSVDIPGKQNMVLHFETVGLQLYMMFLAFCVQFGEPQAKLMQSLCFSISNTYIVFAS